MERETLRACMKQEIKEAKEKLTDAANYAAELGNEEQNTTTKIKAALSILS
jgi:phytoene/squalene synthetase